MRLGQEGCRAHLGGGRAGRGPGCSVDTGKHLRSCVFALQGADSASGWVSSVGRQRKWRETEEVRAGAGCAGEGSRLGRGRGRGQEENSACDLADPRAQVLAWTPPWAEGWASLGSPGPEQGLRECFCRGVRDRGSPWYPSLLGEADPSLVGGARRERQQSQMEDRRLGTAERFSLGCNKFGVLGASEVR